MLEDNSSLVPDQLDTQILKHFFFTTQSANDSQMSSLLNFRMNGLKSLSNYTEACILNKIHSFSRSKNKF